MKPQSDPAAAGVPCGGRTPVHRRGRDRLVGCIPITCLSREAELAPAHSRLPQAVLDVGAILPYSHNAYGLEVHATRGRAPTASIRL